MTDEEKAKEEAHLTEIIQNIKQVFAAIMRGQRVSVDRAEEALLKFCELFPPPDVSPEQSLLMKGLKRNCDAAAKGTLMSVAYFCNERAMNLRALNQKEAAEEAAYIEKVIQARIAAMDEANS
jgi:hypothetical protein